MNGESRETTSIGLPFSERWVLPSQRTTSQRLPNCDSFYQDKL